MRGRGIAGVVMAGLMLLCSFAGAEYQLPGSLITVEEDAFAGIPAIKEITVSESFQMETDIRGAFPTAVEPVWVHAAQGDAALSLLKAGYDVDAGTTYRALLICQTYPESGRALTGPGNDKKAMSYLLTHLSRTKYQVTIRENVSTAAILSSIQTAFGEASEYDVSLFYYSGHGINGGKLVGCENGRLSGNITPAELRSALDQIPGRKIIIVDACYSGGILETETSGDPEDGGVTEMTGDSDTGGETETAGDTGTREGIADPKITTTMSAQTGVMGTGVTIQAISSNTEEVQEDAEETEGEKTMNPADFNTDFLNAFGPATSPGRRLQSARGAGSFSTYYVMTAASATEESYEGPPEDEFKETRMGFFTRHLCRGCGWDGLYGAATPAYADMNEDGVVTFGEAFAYAKREAQSAVSKYGAVQNAQSNVPDLQTFSPFR